MKDNTNHWIIVAWAGGHVWDVVEGESMALFLASAERLLDPDVGAEKVECEVVTYTPGLRTRTSLGHFSIATPLGCRKARPCLLMNGRVVDAVEVVKDKLRVVNG